MNTTEEKIREINPTAENHKKPADYLLAASVQHLKAAQYLKEGYYEQVSQSALLAKEYLELASAAKREDMH